MRAFSSGVHAIETVVLVSHGGAETRRSDRSCLHVPPCLRDSVRDQFFDGTLSVTETVIGFPLDFMLENLISPREFWKSDDRFDPGLLLVIGFIHVCFKNTISCFY